MELGERSGRLVVIDVVGYIKVRSNGKYRYFAQVRCDCGTELLVEHQNFKKISRSCGCLKAEVTRKRYTSHGLSKHWLYTTWSMMRRRCENPADKDYRNYGGRGISVDPALRDVRDFIAYIEAELGQRADGYTLDRIDVNGNYAPGNLRWATHRERQLNRRR